MKKRTIALCLAVLAFFMLIGVGFAAWVISNSAQEAKHGNITVDTVVDNRVQIDYEWKDNKDTVVFGAPATMSATNPWLTNNTGDSMQEVMDLELIVTVKDDAGNPTTGNVTASFASELVFGNYIVAPGSTLTVTPDENVATNGKYHIAIHFAWGTNFNSMNPYNYYNGLDGGVAGYDAVGAVSGSKDNGDVALEYLTAINAFNGSAKFTVTVNVSK